MVERVMRAEFFHRAIIVENTIYLSGITADNKTVGLREQTAQILTKIDRLLKELSSSASMLLMATVYLVDMSQRDEMNAAWADFFEPQNLPARATVGVAQLTPGTLIEVTATALKQSLSVEK